MPIRCSGKVGRDDNLVLIDSCSHCLRVAVNIEAMRNSLQLKVLKRIKSLFVKDDLIFSYLFDISILEYQFNSSLSDRRIRV